MESSGDHKPAAAHIPDRPTLPVTEERDGDAADPDQPIPPDPGKVTDFELGDELCRSG